MSRNEPLGRKSRMKRALLALAALLAALLAWVAFDLNAPRRTSLRDFDPDEVARLETAMWRSYYERERLRLFRQLAGLMRTQYRMPFWRSNATAFRAAKAAFVFKDGRSRADYERALPDLRDFYRSVRDISATDFDADEVARLETAMWRSYYSRRRVKLFRELAELLRTQYRLPPLRSNAVAYRAARAAFVFKDGRSRAERFSLQCRT